MLRYLSYLQKIADVANVKFDEKFAQLCRKQVVMHASQPSLSV